MIKKLISKTEAILLSPQKFWAGEKETLYGRWMLVFRFYLPLTGVASLAVFIGAWIGSHPFYIGYALLKALRELVLFTLLYYVSIFIVNQLLPVFEGQKNLPVVRKLVVFSLMPYLLISVITGLFPAMYVLEILGLYSVYLFYAGVRELIFLPGKKQTQFILVSVLLCLCVFGFLSVLLWKIFVAYY